MQSILETIKYFCTNMFGKRIFYYHFAVWVLYLGGMLLVTDSLDIDPILKKIFSILPAIVVFYMSTLLIFPAYAESRKYVPAFLLVILSCILSTGIRAFLVTFSPVILPPFDTLQFLNQVKVNLLFAGISTVFWFALQRYRNENRMQILEKELAEAKVATLRNQINPHFLHNSLSLLYSKTLPLSDEVSELVGKLSEMMRYSLEEAGDSGLVPIDKEVSHLKNYIDVHRLRFGDKMNVKFELVGDIGQQQVAPLLLLTFVENAFKHGKVNDPDNPVIIKLEVKPDEISLFTNNIKAGGRKDKSSGIGLENVRNRLDLLYPDKYTLQINDGINNYSAYLTIFK